MDADYPALFILGPGRDERECERAVELGLLLIAAASFVGQEWGDSPLPDRGEILCYVTWAVFLSTFHSARMLSELSGFAALDSHATLP